MPRVGDRVEVLIDTAHPERVDLMPPPSVEVTGNSGALSQDAIQDLMSLTTRLHANCTMVNGTVVSLSPTATSASEIVVDIDAPSVPRRRLTITQIIDGPPPASGERVYVMVSPDNPDICALMPASLRKMVEGLAG